MIEPPFQMTTIDQVKPVRVGKGCYRRDLVSRDGVRIWVVDMEPGATWPRVDMHDEHGEDIFVAGGELIEGGQRIPAGSFVAFSPFSSHRPYTEKGVRLFGFNLLRRQEPAGCP